jgi:hypothetical protein
VNRVARSLYSNGNRTLDYEFYIRNMISEKIQAYLNRPIALETGSFARYRQAWFFGVFVFLFLFLFKPFGLDGTGPDLLRITLGYGVVCFLVMIFLNVFVMRLFPNYFEEDHWTLGRDLFWSMVNVMLIGFCNLLFSSWMGIGGMNWGTIVTLQAYTFLVGIFPVSVSLLWKESRLRNKHHRASEALPVRVTIMNENIATIHVASENQGESFEVKKNDLIYLQSAENYVEVYFLENGIIQKRIIRNTLKQLAKDWEGELALFRCHKSYLINLVHVRSVTGNAQGLKAQLEFVDITIPISRLLIDDLKQRMQSLKV